jgi:hypothetical protein
MIHQAFLARSRESSHKAILQELRVVKVIDGPSIEIIDGMTSLRPFSKYRWPLLCAVVV